jgi:hypothetical protein
MGFLEGVICLLNCGGQPREDLLKWWKTVTVFQDAATAALLTYHNRGVHTASPESPKSLFSAKSFGVTRKQLSLFCPDPNKDMPGGMKWLEHAIRRGNAAGSYVLLERGADRNAVLDDGTPLIKLALENNQDMIAMLLLFNWLVMGLEDGCNHQYREFLDSCKCGGSQGATVLRRLVDAAGEMKMGGDVAWRFKLQGFIYGVRYLMG